MKTKKYVHLPTEVIAVQITKENIEELCAACIGTYNMWGHNLDYFVMNAYEDNDYKVYIGAWVVVDAGKHERRSDNKYWGHGAEFLDDSEFKVQYVEVKAL